MDAEPEESLTGGAQSVGLVRVGSTVRRPRHSRSEFVDAVLGVLDAAAFTGAPRALGYDEQGRQILTYIPGFVPRDRPYLLSDAQLVSATLLIRSYHDVTATSALRDGQEVVCHGDLGPHNTVFRGEAAVALIDWDDDLRPGRRADDFAHAVWCFADLIEPLVPVADQARRAQVMCDAYPGMTTAIVIDELNARFHRARDQHESARRPRAVEVFDGLLAWLDEHHDEITGSRISGQ